MYDRGVWPRRLKPPGFRPTATSPCTAHDVDWAFEPAPRSCPKPPSRFCAAFRNATARRGVFDPRIPAAASACSTAPVSSTSLVARGRKPKPPSRLCCFASQRDDRFTPVPPVAFTARIPTPAPPCPLRRRAPDPPPAFFRLPGAVLRAPPLDRLHEVAPGERARRHACG